MLKFLSIWPENKMCAFCNNNDNRKYLFCTGTYNL